MYTSSNRYSAFNTKGEIVNSKIAIHPGEILKDEVESRKLKKSEFAKSIGILPGNLSELFNGKRHINAPLALRLETTLGIEAEFWLRIQSRYELTIERNNLKNTEVVH